MSEEVNWLWPLDAGNALTAALAREVGFSLPVGAPTPPTTDIKAAATALGLEAEPIVFTALSFEEILRASAPAILPMPFGLLAVLGVHKSLFSGLRVRVLTPALTVRSIPFEHIRESVSAKSEAPFEQEIDRLLETCQIAPARRSKARAALLRERLGLNILSHLYQLRLSPGSSFLTQARDAGLFKKLAAFAVTHALEYGLWICSWWLLGQGALSGRTDRGWLLAWALLLLTMAPLQMAMLWLQGQLGLGLGGLLKQRLLLGALRLDQDVIRHQGAGQLLGRVIESSTVESLALGGGLNALSAVLELAMAGFVLASGALGLPHAALLLVWVVLTGVLAWRFAVRRRHWTQSRLRLTDDLVERMTGHRTRLAQQAPADWHTEEDQSLEDYQHRSQAMDKAATMLASLVSRGWLVAALAVLAPAFIQSVSGAGSAIAISLGGVLLAQRALKKLTGSLTQLSGAAIAWEAVSPLFHAAATTPPTAVPATTSQNSTSPVIDAHDLTFRYHAKGEAVLRGASIRILRGDRLLLEGESGGGKSTFTSLLVGLREPASGMLLASGLDRRTLGALGWRRRVVSAPQYHENHILSAPFVFNLLMGRQWPPTEADMKEADEVCRELGLGPLLERMPGGLFQMVGDTGWQLSQGERSRVYIARALLQQADLVVLDESFAALDPVNLRQALECVLRRAPALIVVAHP